MNTQLLVHGLVQQTMVLIAHVATAGGVRAPLASVANQVFLDLTQELSAQGLAKHVIADMFGMALRTYHRKVRALSESQTERGRSVWEAVLEYVHAKQPVSARRIRDRFSNDDPQVVTGVLNDLTNSSLTYRSGRGQEAVYRIADAADFSGPSAERERREAEEYLVWLMIFRQGPVRREDLAESLHLSEPHCERTITQLLAERRIREQIRDGETYYVSQSFDVPVGSEGGWEAAVLDHFQALVGAICVKLRAGASRSQPDDATGGGTYTFDVWPGHPFEQEARTMLARVRAQAIDLRARIDAHNQGETSRAGSTPVVFYLGQYVKTDEGLGGGP